MLRFPGVLWLCLLLNISATANAHTPYFENYVSVGAVQRSDSDKKIYGLDLTIGRSAVLAAYGATLKGFDSKYLLGAFFSVLGFFLEPGVEYDVGHSRYNPYLGFGYSLGYVEVSVVNVAPHGGGSILVGLKLPLRIKSGGLEFIP